MVAFLKNQTACSMLQVSCLILLSYKIPSAPLFFHSLSGFFFFLPLVLLLWRDSAETTAGCQHAPNGFLFKHISICLSSGKSNLSAGRGFRVSSQQQDRASKKFLPNYLVVLLQTQLRAVTS